MLGTIESSGQSKPPWQNKEPERRVNMKTTITNTFHSSSVNVILRDNGILTVSQMGRVRRELCGVAGCCCFGLPFTVVEDAQVTWDYRGPDGVDRLQISSKSDAS